MKKKNNDEFIYPVNPYDPFYDAYFTGLIQDTPLNRWALYLSLQSPVTSKQKSVKPKTKKQSIHDVRIQMEDNLRDSMQRLLTRERYSRQGLVEYVSFKKWNKKWAEDFVDSLHIDFDVQAKLRGLECIKEGLNEIEVKNILEKEKYSMVQIQNVLNFCFNKENELALQKSKEYLELGISFEEWISKLKFDGFESCIDYLLWTQSIDFSHQAYLRAKIEDLSTVDELMLRGFSHEQSKYAIERIRNEGN
ncbi:hypothetical protein [Floccifex sp.]|uniref:hypothetical protein n=1 Tax=Floccifex sp. TaxID=2815810 RepID=UPI003F087985